MPDTSKIPTWDETVELSSDNTPTWESTVEVKKKEPSEVGSEVGGQSQTPAPVLALGYQKVAESGQIPVNPFEQSALGQPPVDEVAKPVPQKPRITSKEINPEFANQGMGEENWKALKSASLRAAGGVIGIPSLVQSSMFEFIEKPIMKMTGATDDEIDVQRIARKLTPTGTLPATINNEQTVQKLNSAASNIEATMKQYEGGIIESIDKGDFGSAIRQLTKGVVQSLPYLAGVAATSGGGAPAVLTTLGTAAASQRKGEIEEQGLMEGKYGKQLFNAWLYGGFEAGGELVTAGIFNNMRRALKGASQEVIKKTSNEIATEFLKEFGSESGSEMATELGQQLTDYFQGNRDNINLKEVGDAGIIGGFAVGPVSGTTAIANSIKGARIASKEDIQKVQGNQEKIVDLKDKLNNTDNPVIKETIQEEISQAEKENNDIAEKNAATASQLTPEQLSQVSNINRAIDENDAVIAEKQSKNEDIKIEEEVKEKLSDKKKEALKKKPKEKEGEEPIQTRESMEKYLLDEGYTPERAKEMMNMFGEFTGSYEYVSKGLSKVESGKLLPSQEPSPVKEQIVEPKITEEPINATEISQNEKQPKGQVSQGGNVTTESGQGGEVISGKNIQQEPEAGAKAGDEGKRLVKNIFDSREEYLNLSQNTQYGKLDKQNKGSDSKLQVGGVKRTGTDSAEALGKQPRYDNRASGKDARHSSVKEYSLSDKEISDLTAANKSIKADKSFSEIDSADLFFDSITKSKENNPHSASVVVYPKEDYKKYKKIITDDGKAGLAVDDNNTIISVFSHGEGKGRVPQLIIQAVKEGANKLDHYDTALSDYYYRFGFVPVARVKWNDEYAVPDWDKSLYKEYNNGEPDVVLMAYHGGDPNTLSERYGKFGSFKDAIKNAPYVETFEEGQRIQEEYVNNLKKQKPPETEPEVAKKEAAITEEKFESAVTKGLDKGIEWLDEIDKQLSQFGKETLGVNLPVAVAQTGIRAAKVALQAGKNVSEVIDAAIDAVRKSDWYKGLTSEDKKDAEQKIRGLFTKETKIEESPKPKTERVSAIKKASVPEEKIEETKINKRTVQGEVQRGKDLVDKGEIVPANLVSEVNANPRALNSDEIAALVYYKTQLDNSFDEIYDNLEKAQEEQNDNDIIEYKRQLDIANIALNNYYEAALNTAYEQGLAFRMRQILMDSEYNLATQVRKYKQINNGVIPPEIKTKFEEYDRRLKELNGKIRKLEERKAKSEGDEVIEKIKSSSKRKGRKMGKDLIEEGFDELMQAIGGKAMAIGDKRPSAIAALSKIGLGLIDEGVATIENVVAKIEEYVKSKNKDFNIDEYKEDLVKEINELRGISYNEDGLIKIPHDLLRSYVEKGIDNINDLVSAIKKDFQLDITDRELRDAITNYGKTIDLNKEEIEVKLREMRRIGRLLSGLEDVQKEKKRPLRSGLQRDKLSDKERRMQKELKESMKDLPLTDEEISKAWRTSLDAVKSRLKNQIADLIHRIDTGERTPNKKGIAYDEEANQLKEQRDLLQSILEKIEGKKEISDEQKVRMAIANVERMMDSYEERIREKDFSPFKRAVVPQTPELIDAKKKLADIKALYNQMKEDAGIVEAMRLQRIKTNLNKSIKEYEKRLREKDFSTKKRDKPILDEEALKLEIERNKIKYLYETEMEKAAMKNRPFHKKAWDTFIDVYNLSKSFLASLDFSGPLRQGAILSFAHPKVALLAFKDMFKFTFSAKKAQDWVDRMRASDDYVIMKRSGLYLSEPTAKLSAKEEQFMTNLAHKIPIYGKLVSATERAYVGYLNKLRVDVFLQGVDYLNSLGFDFQHNTDKYRIYADFINNAAGRGKLGFAEPIAKELNTMFFSPRLVASRINLLYLPKYKKMPKEVRKMVLRDMGIFVGTGMTILAIAAAAGADVEDDPRSSDFGKIKIGNLRFDIWAGFQQPIRAFVQLVTGQRKSVATGVVSKISKQEFPNKSRWSVLGNFVRSKMSPTSGLIYNIVEGENMMGEDVTLKTIVESSLIPLYLNDVAEIYKEEGLSLTIAGASASLFGVGVQHYSDTDPVKKAIRNNLSLEETLKRITTNEDLNVFTTPLLVKPKELTDRQINEVKKRYAIYKKYGLDNPDINFLISKGVNNEVKAGYLVDMKKKGKRFDIDEYVIDRVISSDTKWQYVKMSNEGSGEELEQLEISQ